MLGELDGNKLKSMSLSELAQLCDEIRQKIISTVFSTGGHLSSNLGVVEITVALHYVFDFPQDKLIFDVGHQCYAHKLLTGRCGDFNKIRQRGGISGFPKREESGYDCYNTGHAGTSVSAALGIAKARDIKGGSFNVIALIGDGSFNNGLVYEAFNSLKPLGTNILLVLNDNGMSISPTVGSMHEYLEILSEDTEEKAKRARHAGIFEKFGFTYDGVYDGNDLAVMIEKLTEIKERLKTQSVILHIITKKGKGYVFCEEFPEQTHGIPPIGSTAVSVEYSEVLGKKLCELATRDSRVVAVTAAMTSSLGLGDFFREFPDRSIDVGICEEHATILCASMATEGLKPYYAVYSTFLQRSFDEILIDICSQKLPVTICVDRAGISGADGETHQGVFDLSFLSMAPNLTIAVPKDVNEFEQILEMSLTMDSPLAIRYPREGKRVFDSQAKLEVGRWEIMKKGCDCAILACGERAIVRALAASELCGNDGIEVAVINARFVKPLDTALLDSLACGLIVTVEDNMLTGGFGSLVNAHFSLSGKRVKNFAYADEFIPQGSAEELMSERGLDEERIFRFIYENR